MHYLWSRLATPVAETYHQHAQIHPSSGNFDNFSPRQKQPPPTTRSTSTLSYLTIWLWTWSCVSTVDESVWKWLYRFSVCVRINTDIIIHLYIPHQGKEKIQSPPLLWSASWLGKGGWLTDMTLSLSLLMSLLKIKRHIGRATPLSVALLEEILQ